MAIFYSHNSSLRRSTKALSFATQVKLIATIVSMFGLFIDIKEDSSSEVEEWNMADFEIYNVLMLMRLLQSLLGMGLSRDESTSSTFVCTKIAFFLLIYLICTTVVFMTAEKRAKRGAADDRERDPGLPGRGAARLGHVADATMPHYVRQVLQKEQRGFHALQGAASLMSDERNLVMDDSPNHTTKYSQQIYQKTH